MTSAGRFVHRLDRRSATSQNAAARVQEGPSRDGRQERHHGDGRCRSRSGGGGVPLGRIRHDAVSDAPPPAAWSFTRRCTRSSSSSSSRRAKALRVGDGLDRRSRWARSVSEASCDGHRSTWRSGSRRARGCCGRKSPRRDGAYAHGLFPRADDLRATSTRRCASPRRRSSVPWSR